MAVKNIDLSNISEEELLNLKVCELPLSIKGSWLQDCVEELYAELDAKGLNFKPLCYLADEWLTPDQEPVVGIPFFLAHPTLIKLEKKMIIEVEGGTKPWCLKLLRHETGHAINYAYKLHKRKKWRDIFGQFSQEYGDTYRFRPYSRSFVKHLENYYAQYHPDEDFAETFAVWLNPEIDWKTQYKGWKALKKLNYVDEVMNEIKNKKPLKAKGQKYWQASKMRISLKNFYKKKRYSYAEEFPDFHDSNLKKMFTPLEKDKFDREKSSLTGLTSLEDAAKISVTDSRLAANAIKRYKKEILNNVAKWTGERKYIINELLDKLIRRCKELKLLADKDEPLVMLEITAYVTALVMNYVYTGGFRKEEQ